MKLCLLAAGFVLLPVFGCTGVPKGPEPVRCCEVSAKTAAAKS